MVTFQSAKGSSLTPHLPNETSRLLKSGLRAEVRVPFLLSNRDEALRVDDTLSRGQNCRLLELLRVSALRDVLQESQLPKVPSDSLRGPQAVPGLMALGRRLRHLDLQIAFVLQVHDGTAKRERREAGV